MYTIERNYCDCHPATCNCNPWVIKKDGAFFVTIDSKENGDLIVKAMNEMERRQNNANYCPCCDSHTCTCNAC